MSGVVTQSNQVTEIRSSDRSGWTRMIEASVRRVLGFGKTRIGTSGGSLRVGRGTGLSSLDGSDGIIAANGALAALLFGNRAFPNSLSYGSWLFDGTSFLLSGGGGTVWTIDPNTGFIAQPVFVAITYGTNCGAASGVVVGSGSRRVVPAGDIELIVSLTTTGAVAASAVVATVTAAHFPALIHPFPCKKVTAGGVITASTGSVNASGQVITDVALANGDFLYVHWRYFIS